MPEENPAGAVSDARPWSGAPAPTPPGVRGWRARAKRVAIVLAVLAVAGLVASEIVLRMIVGLGDPPIYVTNPRWEYDLKPGVYHRFGHTVSINRWMQRGPDVTEHKTEAREVRVLVIGDSVVNAGAATPDEMVAAELLTPELVRATGGPARAINISCGTWGPTNELEYVREFGTFDADAAVLVLNSVDWGDEPTFVLTPEQPTRKPWLALEEVVTNYGPRALGHQFGPGGDDTRPAPAEAAKSLESLRNMVALLRQRGIGVVAVLHLRQSESTGTPYEGHERLKAQLEELKVPIIESAAYFLARRGEWKTLWRDDIHPSREGQVVLMQVFKDAALAALGQRGGRGGAGATGSVPPAR
ncbi:hypothetical protein BH11PLA1_BH11PLA1_21910 [soil metagenome]